MVVKIFKWALGFLLHEMTNHLPYSELLHFVTKFYHCEKISDSTNGSV